MSDLLPEQQPPEQASSSKPPDALEIEANLICTPNLDQSTIVPRTTDSVTFTVLLEGHSSTTDHAEVVLWHNHNGEHDWNELHLKRVREDKAVLLLGRSQDQAHLRNWFTAELHGQPKHGHKVSFTIKYRLSSNKPWRWIKDDGGVQDGELYYQAPAAFMQHSTDYKLDHFVDNISSDIEVQKVEAETNNTQLYSLTCPIKAAKGEDSGYQHHRLGEVKKGERWFALVRLWSPWLAPRHGDGKKFELDKEAVLVSFLRSDGLHVVCLAISGIQDILTTFIHEDNNVVIKGRNDREDTGTSRVLVAVAENFEVANCAVMYHARKIVAQHPFTETKLADDANQIKTLTEDNVKPEWLQEWYDGLTYCTWNGLGQGLTAEKIYNALEELSKNDISITNLIIDDNWQTLSSGDSQFKRGWSNFEANPSGFPDGMKATTAEIRRRNPNVNHIAVWHAILGYWGGMDPNGAIAKRYKTIEVEMESGVAGGTFTVVAPEDSKQMYDDFYSFLSDSGIDAVKTDAQFFLDMLLHAPDRRSMIVEYQDAWTLAHLRHFSSRAISCMSQFPQALFHSQLPRNKPLLLVRNSDDFFPEVEASHAWHVFCNAHNSLFTQHLNALPDWDMFQTSHDWASFHAAARCVSGGPIYFTDEPGKHDIGLIKQMTAQTVQKKTVILRPQMIGKTVGSVYNSYDAKAVLKVGTFVGRKGSGTGIIGCFNVSGETLNEFIHLHDFPGTEDTGDYIVASFRSGEVSIPLQGSSKHAAVSIALEKRGWDILSTYAVQLFTVHEQPVSVACMGLLGKMTGSAAVTNTDTYVESNGRLRIWVSLKALGVLGLWISDLASRSVEEDFFVMIYGQPVPEHCVKKNKGQKGPGGVLEVDIERAWKEMDLKPGWSNEVAVEVFIG